jgi:transcriptional regulator with XRE-family HTH domain
MGAAKAIKQLMQEQNISVSQLASALGIQAQSMSNKLYRDSFSFDEVVRIADILGSDVKLIVRETRKEFY